MGTRKFKVSELSTTRVYRGEITAADIRQRFRLPETVEITVVIPESGATLYLTDDVPLHVEWELVTKGDV